ncbi:MAG: xanthine dehydrogenase accessory protein XdhC [Microlunatus sp.]|nr:xanthine dehydrogenase accessory protein XdhC [Microlunatus sp.]MDN5769870.1 xanthine dehydrogenase accessory protein XdhC [Microlunatus sp.]MDN5803298.1 xanthine dehydrogenase accessory protein XdhC [Microlunatus sp.]
MDWLSALERLRSRREAGVMVTLVSVRGHSPRAAGAKMVVSAEHTWDSIGGGNLEAVAVTRARGLLARFATEPATFTVNLSDQAPVEHGVQCCGGQVRVLLDPLPVLPAVAVFGVGHVGWELALILARHELDLHLIDSRPEQFADARLAVLADATARVHTHHVPVLPELVLGELPPGTHVLVMTHDHAEDAALVDAALRTEHLASIGLIGSSAKWSRFGKKLRADGHEPDVLARVTTPIGLPELAGKDPATIAVGVAAALLMAFERETTMSRAQASPPVQDVPPGGRRTKPVTERR